MMNLILFAPFQPTPGMAIWSLVIFLLFWFIFGKLAFKPILNSLTNRENDIQKALDEAKLAREEMSKLKSENEAILTEAREERAAMIKEAKDAGKKIVEEAKSKAKEDAQKIIDDARIQIEQQKTAAMTEVRKEVGIMALDIAEKIMKKDLASNTDHQTLVSKLVSDITNN